MTPMQEHVENWLNEGYAPEQIIRAASRLAARDYTDHEYDIVETERIRMIGEMRRRVDEFDGFFKQEEDENE